MTARDAGLRRISSVTRRLVVGAVALSGALALIAANTFHGRTIATGGSSLSSSRQGTSFLAEQCGDIASAADQLRRAQRPLAGADSDARAAGRRLRRIMSAQRSWSALGTSATVVVERSRAPRRGGRLRARGDRGDRPRGQPLPRRLRVRARQRRRRRAGAASASTFVRAARCALRAARITGGDLDPTIGTSLRVAGYDRDFALIRAGRRGPLSPRRAAGAASNSTTARGMIRLPAGRRARLRRHRQGARGRPRGGAARGASIGGRRARQPRRRHRNRRRRRRTTAGRSASPTTTPPAPARAGQTIALRTGGLATSSTTRAPLDSRRRRAPPHPRPRDGRPAPEVWRTVSVAAACCVDANIASTTAIIRGARRPAWLESPRASQRGWSPPMAP